ncbi:hypothetical protein CTA1_3945 [Colletotrichum tanaceti]|uniref:Uncharacterized protein n=1 Tax=Colletotrichum tanaceti TaxID=1306861 RepID=A0A4U6X7X1_9PEZI|nr:hypothetical protein CTA1_3945 [Colletotrichum tanaceti]
MPESGLDEEKRLPRVIYTARSPKTSQRRSAPDQNYEGRVGSSNSVESDQEQPALRPRRPAWRSVNVDFANRWRNSSITWAFVVFDVAAAFFLYWFARVPNKSKVRSN